MNWSSARARALTADVLALANAATTLSARCDCPASTLSRAESWGKTRTSWNVRPTPRAQTPSGLTPTRLWPRSRMSPASGASAPAMQWKSVVLPEPFGPISPTISPASTVMSTPASAVSPPKCLATPLTSRRLTDRRGGPRYGPPHPPTFGRAAAQPRRASGLPQDVSRSLRHEPGSTPAPPERDHAARHPERERHDDRAVHHLVDADSAATPDDAHRFGERDQHERADDRPRHRAEPAEDGHEHHTHREHGRHHAERIDVRRVLRVERPGHPGDERAAGQRGELVAPQVDAEPRRRFLVLIDRAQVDAEAGALDLDDHERHRDGHGEDDHQIRFLARPQHVARARNALHGQHEPVGP